MLMTNSQMSVENSGVTAERRKFKRYRVDEGLYAVCGANSPRMGRILDISEGGLSFSHRNLEKIPRSGTEVTILFDGNQTTRPFHFKFDAKPVSEIKIRKQTKAKISRKRCAVQFTEMTCYRKKWLKQIIENHTNGEA